jgi:hypothetical protein
MYFYGRRVKETLMTATLRNRDVLAVVTYTDGRCGLARNNQPMHVFSWPHKELDECVITFLRLIASEGLLTETAIREDSTPARAVP